MQKAIIVGILGGLFNLEGRAIGELMFSQPLVAGTITGWLLGDVHTGLIIGAILQLIWINMLPVGASIPPDSSLASVLGVTFAISLLSSHKLPSDIIMAYSVALAIPLGLVAKWMDFHLREFNANLSHRVSMYASHGNTVAIDLITGAAVVLSFFKGFILCFIATLLADRILLDILVSLPHQIKDGLRLSWKFFPAIGIAVIINMFCVKKFISFFIGSYLFVVILLAVAGFSKIILFLIVLSIAILMAFEMRKFQKDGEIC